MVVSETVCPFSLLFPPARDELFGLFQTQLTFFEFLLVVAEAVAEEVVHFHALWIDQI